MRWGVALLVGLVVVALLSLRVRPEEAPGRAEATMERARALHAHHDRVEQALRASLAAIDPELLAGLDRQPPPSRPAGYQVLPELGEPATRSGAPAKPRVAAYSWPWTDTRIGWAEEELAALERRVAALPDIGAERRREEAGQIVLAFGGARGSLATVDAHVGYNALWQREIAANRAGYDRETDRMAAIVAGRAPGGDGRPPSPAPFVRLEHPAPRRWVVRLPLETDILDPAFLDAVREGVESRWHVVHGEDEYLLRIDLRRRSPAELHAGTAGGPPRPGEAIDTSAHCARFSQGAGKLTTGAGFLHVAPGSCILLGPEAITVHVLAHEVGHLLGFPDVYVRGYRDLGRDGFEVLEIAAVPDDIMGSPGDGPVTRRHFEPLVDVLGKR
ncbi:MAG: hypothetical protein WCK73_12380 [Deltaproteobacteria bacterium]